MEKINAEQPRRAAEGYENVGRQQFERPASPDRSAETARQSAQPQPLAPPAADGSRTFADPSAARVKEIESVLEEDLASLYFNLNDHDQAVFRQTGEQTAYQINALLSEFKIQVKKIADLIRNWLRILPGVNKFFLEQETKIKTDKIIDRYIR